MNDAMLSHTLGVDKAMSFQTCRVSTSSGLPIWHMLAGSTEVPGEHQSAQDSVDAINQH